MCFCGVWKRAQSNYPGILALPLNLLSCNFNISIWGYLSPNEHPQQMCLIVLYTFVSLCVYISSPPSVNPYVTKFVPFTSIRKKYGDSRKTDIQKYCKWKGQRWSNGDWTHLVILECQLTFVEGSGVGAK